MLLYLLFFYEEETPNIITMGFVWSQILLLIVSKKICSIWLWDNNPCNRSKGRSELLLCQIYYTHLNLIGLLISKQNEHYCCHWHAFTVISSLVLKYRLEFQWFSFQFLKNNLSFNLLGSFKVKCDIPNYCSNREMTHNE